jgi:putative radical SAM enzyme (TIGR03279 family)
MIKITNVLCNSLAKKAGVLSGDVLLTINGNEINDVLDYRFYLTETTVTLECLRGDAPLSFTIKKGEYTDIGLDFETPLMDKKRSCHNNCIFCFIDQLPDGMRDTLYFKDDDSRLSFLHGNYITLTNLTDKDVDRIVKMHLSPINVSVHTTNPELRVTMMKNKNAGKVLSYLERFKEAGLTICAQIVLCKNINDKEELDRSMRDLEKLLPALSSCSVVPVGLTKHRDGLYPLEAFDGEECAEVIKQVTAFGDECLKKHGTRIFYCGDEFYVKSGLPIPEDDFYEDYAQLENGVGMLRLLDHEFNFELDYVLDGEQKIKLQKERKISIATGAAAYESILAIAKLAQSKISGLTINVYKITNEFFGESVTVSGLLTGIDLAKQLSDKELGEELLLPANTLRAEGDLFLCGMSHDELSAKLGGQKIRFCKNDGNDLLSAFLGYEPI